MRQDRTMLASEQFIQAVLGEEYVTPVTDLMVDIFEETQPNKPVLYLLSAGADPTSSIDEYAKKHK
jgi:dynein heavy chain